MNASVVFGSQTHGAPSVAVLPLQFLLTSDRGTELENIVP